MPLTRGIQGSNLKLGQPRVLTRDDLALLAEKRPVRPITQRFRDPHHRLARLIAMGNKLNVAAGLAGYSAGRAYMLSVDPGFQELVAQYRKMVNEEFKEATDEFYSMASSNMIKAERQISEHLERADEEGELLPLGQLITLASDGKDRFGYEKKKQQTNLNINADFASMLEKAIARSGKQIDVPAVRREGAQVSAQVSSSHAQPGPLEPPRLRRIA